MSTPNYFPADWQRIWVIGQYIDMTGAPLRGRVTFTANVAGRRLIDRAHRLIITTAVFTADLDTTGYFEVQIPAGDDPDLNPTGFNYSVTDPTGQYLINVPIGTPPYPVLNHPRSGDQVIDLYDVVPAAAPATGTVQLVSGRGITTTAIDDNNHLIVTYSDGTTADAGNVGGSTGGATEAYVDGAVAGHAIDPTPHPEYDDLPSLTLLFRNRLV